MPLGRCGWARWHLVMPDCATDPSAPAEDAPCDGGDGEGGPRKRSARRVLEAAAPGNSLCDTGSTVG